MSQTSQLPELSIAELTQLVFAPQDVADWISATLLATEGSYPAWGSMATFFEQAERQANETGKTEWEAMFHAFASPFRELAEERERWWKELEAEEDEFQDCQIGQCLHERSTQEVVVCFDICLSLLQDATETAELPFPLPSKVSLANQDAHYAIAIVAQSGDGTPSPT